MKQISEFPTLQDARDYLAYRDISANKARHFFSLNGVLDHIEQSQDSTAQATVIEGRPTTVGQLCRAVIGTLSANAPFIVDPNLQDGALTRAAATQIGLSDSIVSDFLSLGEYKPYENVAKHEYLVARNECPKKPVTQSEGWITINVSTECENHSPRIFVDHPVLGVIQISSIKGVSEVKGYHARVPSEFSDRELYIDDAYGVIK